MLPPPFRGERKCRHSFQSLTFLEWLVNENLGWNKVLAILLIIENICVIRFGSSGRWMTEFFLRVLAGLGKTLYVGNIDKVCAKRMGCAVSES